MTSAQPFTEVSTSLPAILGGSVAWGDYDNDNAMDVLVAGFGPSLIPTCKVIRNDGAGTFVDIDANLPAIQYGFATWVDYNNDGLLDIFLTGQDSNSVSITRIYRNVGGNSFVDAQVNLPQYIFEFAEWGDFDNDGDPDLLGGFGELYRNDGNGRFTKMSPGWPNFSDSSGAWADFDNDGDLDILISGLDYSLPAGVSSKVFRNDGDGIFSDIGANLPGLRYGTVTWGDYNNDGKLDIFLRGSTNYQLSGVISKIFHNDGNGVFQDSGFALPPINYGSARWLDFDNDGYLDLILVSDYENARLYRNVAGTSLTNSGIVFGTSQNGRTAWDWCDYDADGDLDLYLSATTNTLASRIERNDTSIPNLPPATPTGLQATVSGRSAALSWNAATDPNQTGGLTYNLRIGTTPGGVDIVSPISDPNTGFRRLPRIGNVQHNLTWSIHHLAIGIYYWSVQAVDSAFAGSTFAVEETFTVTLLSTNPFVLTDPATQISRFDATANGLVYPNGLDTTVVFEFGTDTNYGALTVSQQLSGSLSATNISAQISSLIQGTIYHYRLVATNSDGVSYGRDQTFLTQNYYPNISNIPDMQFAVAQLSISTNFVVSDPESPAEQLVVTAYSSNTNFVRDEDILFSGSGSNRIISVSRVPNQIGTATITVTVTDPQGALTSDKFLMSVRYFTLIGSLGIGGRTAAWGDYDNDGNLDVLHQSGTTSLYRNNGNQTFSNVPPTYPFGGGALAWGDYDNDGDLDFLLNGNNTQTGRFDSRLLRNNGNGTFATNLIAGLTNVGYGAVAWGDFDNDGRLDMLLTGSTNTIQTAHNIARVYRNNGNQTFSNIVAGLPEVELSSVAWGDYDNDGRLDFALTGGVGGNISRIYHNNGDNTFTDIAAGLRSVVQGSVAWGDSDNDGYLDILLTGNTGTPGSPSGFTRVYHNNRDGTFTGFGAGLPNVSDGSAAWGDFDNDGYLDILIAGRVNSFGLISRVYINNQNGSFTDLQAGLPGMGDGTAAWGDCDNDGDLDVLLSWDGFTRVYQNNFIHSNTPPTVPTNLLASILPHNNVVLNWSASTDNETTNSKGLYYNLRVGTNSGGIQLFSPQADLTTGLRRLPGFGNAGHTNQWLISNLPQGTYYWSVQAIDTSLAGSPFASEGSFTISNALDVASNHAPVAEPQTVSVDEDTTVPITLTGSDADGDALNYIVAVFPKAGVLAGIPPNLTYKPKTNYFGQDSFSFRVRDGLTTSATVDIGITIAPVQDVAELRVAQSIATDFSYVEIIITGEPYHGYALEASTNLLDWLVVTKYTNSVSITGVFVNNLSLPLRFFRARTLP